MSRANKRKKFYITTAIAYVNSHPHIGHSLEVIQADALARYMRASGYDVFFGTGTDEHGDKIARAAAQSGQTTARFVNEISGIFKSMRKTFNLSYDAFIRTSNKKEHWLGAYKLWAELVKKGDIYKKEYDGLYCVGCEKFLTDKDLVEGECPLHKKKPEKISEENYFFKLAKYERKIEQAIVSDKIKIIPETRKNEVLAFVRGGLEDISFSRSKQAVAWGIPILNSDQTMYVWCDALSNYISMIGYGRDYQKFKKWWPANAHIIGKDILRFHAIYWPAVLLSAGLSLPKTILVHGFITIDGQKMSKTLGNVIDPFEAQKKYGTDAIRYYLLREIPSDGDGDFSWRKLKDRYNDDLAKGLGNFISRSSNLLAGEKIAIKSSVSAEVKAEIKRMKLKVKKHMDEFRLHDSLAAIFALIQFGDKYINDREPWKYPNHKIWRDMAELAMEIGKAIIPFMPEAGEKILKAFPMKSGYIIPKKIKPLFPRAE